MTGGTTGDIFHDMIAKVVFEHERVRAENLQLQRAIAGVAVNYPASAPWPMGAAMPVATIPAEPKGSPNPPWAPVVGRLPVEQAFPVGEADWPSTTPPQETPWLLETTAPQVSATPETQAPCTLATSFMPHRFTQTAEGLGAQSTPAGEPNSDESSHTARWSVHAVESQPAQGTTLAHPTTAAKDPKFRGHKKFDPARADSNYSVPVPRNSGRFTVQKSLSFDENDKQSVSKETLISFALPSSLKRVFSESSCVLSLKRIVNTPAFDMFFALAVVAYAVFIGYDAAWVARNLQQQSRDLDIAHGLFNLIFLVELIMRVVAEGPRFFVGEAWRWNVLDVLLVLASCVDFLILRHYMNVSHGGGIRTVRVARILRLLRTVRIMRTVKSVHELHKMLYSFLSSMRTLLCASLVLAFVMYFFSILFTVAAAEQRSMNLATHGPLQTYYGTLGRTFRSLFWAISNGVSWSAMYEPIAETHWAYGFCFFMYIIIVMFGVLNVVTSVFVESAFLSAQYYRDLIVKDKECEKAVASGHMMAVFNQMDQNRSGGITRDEMEFFLQEPGLRQYLEALDLSADDTRMLYRLLDQDGSGVIDVNEFCTGCLKLKGEAKSIDVHILMLQTHRFLKKWSAFTEYVEDQFNAIDRDLLLLGRLHPNNRGDV